MTRFDLEKLLEKTDEEFEKITGKNKEQFVKEWAKETLNAVKESVKDCFCGDFDLLRRMLLSDNPSVLVGNDLENFVQIALKCFVEYRSLIPAIGKHDEINKKHNLTAILLYKLCQLLVNKKINMNKFEKVFAEVDFIYRDDAEKNFDTKEANQKLNELLNKILKEEV